MKPEQQLLTNFNQLIGTPDSVRQLRRFILDLAICGRLVPQDATDEPASELLKRVDEQKGAERQPSFDAADVIKMPEGWCAVPLIRIGTWAVGAGFPKNEQGKAEGPFMFLKVSDMNLPGNEKHITVANNFIDEKAARRMRAKVHPPGTIIFPKIGGAIATNKRRILTIGAAIDNNCLGITFSSEIETEWAYILLTSLDFSKYQAGTAVPALQQSTLEKIPISLPPVAEQRRIVGKFTELMALCDRLEASLAFADNTRSRLLEALLAEALAPAEVRELEAAE
jgi:type I restriction enzyme, S subunit